MIGYYVHHQGRGHLQRARSIARASGEEVVGLSSLPPPGEPFADWLQLPPDDAATGPTDVTAQETLHWAPLRDRAASRRAAALTSWVATDRPRAVVVDVSVEATLAVRLAGAPVIVVAQPGERGDPAHQLAYSMASAVLACWTREVYDPDWLRPHHGRTAFVGALSRYDGRRPAPERDDLAVVLAGAGGRWDGDGDVVAGLGAAAPDLRWHTLTGSGGAATDDPWDLLSAAAVVVSHGGQNALAELAAARRPTVVVPQARPFGEQVATARALHQAAIVRTSTRWPDAAEWPGLLADARRLDRGGWARWSPGDAAARAARVIARVASAGASW